MQFTGIVESFDDDEGCGTIIRDSDRQPITVRTAGLALGVDSLAEGDHVAFDVLLGTDWQARNVTRC